MNDRAVSRREVVLRVGLAVIAVAAFIVLLRHVPFKLASFAAWGGIATAALGLVSVARPIRCVGMRNRRWGLAVVALGIVTTAAAVMWPVTPEQVADPHQRLDGFMPSYQFSEYHEGRTRAPRARVEEALRCVSFSDMPAAKLLMRLRAAAGGEIDELAVDPRPILELMEQPGSGFLALDVSDPSELVYGMVGRPWTSEAPPPVTTAEDFLAFDQPGHIRVAFNLRVVDVGGGVLRVSTETRALGNDDGATRVFARYWRIIYPGSSIIRRVWLDAIIGRAERSDSSFSDSALPSGA